MFITLIAGVNGAPGYTGSGTVVGIYGTKTDDTGHWSIDLTPNSAFTPANTPTFEWFRLRLTKVSFSGGSIWTILKFLQTLLRSRAWRMQPPS